MRCSILTNTFNLYLLATQQEEDVDTWCIMHGEYEYNQEFVGLAETKYPGAFIGLYKKNAQPQSTANKPLSLTTHRIFVIRETSPLFNLWLSTTELTSLVAHRSSTLDRLISIETKFRINVI